MIKKMKYIIPIILIIAVIFPVTQNSKKDLEVYLEDYFYSTQDIILIEYTDEGAYIFKNFSEDHNVCFYMRKSYFGWKYDYDVYSGVAVLKKQSGFSLSDLPKKRHVEKPLYFGQVIDKEISRITFKNIETQKVENASINSIDNIRLWTMYVDSIRKDGYIISSYAKNDELISRVEIDSDKTEYKYYKNIDEEVKLKTLYQ